MATKRMQDSLENRKSEFGFGEYAETVGPQGLLFVLKGTLCDHYYFMKLICLTNKIIPPHRVKRQNTRLAQGHVDVDHLRWHTLLIIQHSPLRSTLLLVPVNN